VVEEYVAAVPPVRGYIDLVLGDGPPVEAEMAGLGT
jgi:hypothetical protein